MIEATTTHRYTAATTVIGVLAALYAVTFFLGDLLHLGVRIPPGFSIFAEPQIIDATIVEGAWPAAITVHAFALGAFCSVWRRWLPGSARAPG